MRFYITFAMVILSLSVWAESAEVQELRKRIEESNNKLSDIIYELQNLPEDQLADAEFINKSFQPNNEEILRCLNEEDNVRTPEQDSDIKRELSFDTILGGLDNSSEINLAY